MPTNTITTACDVKFLWGAYLLVASLRANGVKHPVQIWLAGGDESSARLLDQFENVRVTIRNAPDGYSLNMIKPDCLLMADTETATWLDSDCVVTGDISRYLVAPNESLQVRFRSKQENPLRFRKKYAPTDPPASIPAAVLETWKNDVNERNEPAITTTCANGSLVIHRKHFGFLEKWRALIRALAPRYRGVKESAYTCGGRISDELILNALLAFSDKAPPVSPYLLDTDPKAYLLHFGERPKPWERWQSSHLRHYRRVMESIDWCVGQGYRLPPRPRSLTPSWRPLFTALAHIEGSVRGFLRRSKQLVSRD